MFLLLIRKCYFHLVLFSLLLFAIQSGSVISSQRASITGIVEEYVAQHIQWLTADHNPNEPAMLLGAQLMLSITSSDAGQAAQIIAGTTIGIRKRLQETRHVPNSKTPTSLVVASLDGNQQQQTWHNLARATASAARIADTSGTLVLWTDISDAPTGCLLRISDDTAELGKNSQTEIGEDLPLWDPTLTPAYTLRKLTQEYRILLHSGLPPEEVEALGIGTIQSGEELRNLTRSFANCNILRAASFYGPSYNWPEPSF